MTIWANVTGSKVFELTNVDPAGRYPASMLWIDCTATAGVAQGWLYLGGSVFLPPGGITVAQALANLSGFRDGVEGRGVQFQASGAAVASFYDTSPAGQTKIIAAYVAARDGLWIAGTPMAALDNTYASFTAADATALALKAMAYISACGLHAQYLAGLIESDPSVDITQAWPNNL